MPTENLSFSHPSLITHTAPHPHFQLQNRTMGNTEYPRDNPGTSDMKRTYTSPVTWMQESWTLRARLSSVGGRVTFPLRRLLHHTGGLMETLPLTQNLVFIKDTY